MVFSQIQLSLLVIFIALYLPRSTALCPSECQCAKKGVVSCVDKNISSEILKVIAKSLPNDTKVLKLNRNKITYFPTEDFINFKSLRELRLSDNLLEVFPQNLSVILPLVKIVFIANNLFKGVSKYNLEGYKNIITLDVNGNAITELPEHTFSNSVNLKQLSLQHNRISKIDETAFVGLGELTELKLNNNLLTSIPVDTFKDLTILQDLYLSNNFLTDIPSILFMSLKKLYILELKNNSIATIGPSAFSGELDIDLSNNKITKLYKSSFKDVTIYDKLKLDDNPINCDCNLYEVYSLLKKKSSTAKITGNCHTPASVFNLQIDNVMAANTFNCTACSTSPCKNNGTCSIVGDDYRCACITDYEGKQCKDKKICASNPCFNNGRCEDVNKTSYSCNCTEGFQGHRCEKEEICWKNPCLNNGSCDVVDKNNFKCNCTQRFRGILCEKEAMCWTNPCLNNGSCIVMDENDFKCNCTTSYEGELCQDVRRRHDGKNKKFKAWWIVLIVLAVVTCILLIVFLVYMLRKRASYSDVSESTALKEKNVDEKTPLNKEAVSV